MPSLLEGIASALISSAGYKAEYFARDYAFMAEERVHRADLMAFLATEPAQKDISSSILVVQQIHGAEERQVWLRRIAFTAAPLALFVLGDKIEGWPVQHPPLDKSAFEFWGLEEFEDYLQEHRLDFIPESLLAAKKSPKQLTFFHYGFPLYHYAAEANHKTLLTTVVGALKAGASLLPRQLSHPQKKRLSRLTMQILGARILEDKGLVTPQPDLRGLLAEGRRHFPSYFWPRDLKRLGEPVGEAILEELRADVNFSTVTSSMLAHVYEHAFITPTARRYLGIHYTAPEVAEQLLRRLPIEEIPREDRYVLDGTCGSGSLLIAAYNRLNGLLPAGWPRRKKHDWLTERIWGVDTDPFAVAVAKLGLLLTSLPTGDSWSITPNDLFDTQFPHRPRIIVANPPFHESAQGKRTEVALRFLERYLELLAPGGLLGIILPEPFLTRISSREMRQRLLSGCDILEVWHLPRGLIKSSDLELSGLLLSKRQPASRPYPIRVERILPRAADLHNYRVAHVPTYSWIANSGDWASDSERAFRSSPFDTLWKRLRSRGQLDEWAWLFNGINASDCRPEDLSDEPKGSDWVKFLWESRAIAPYRIGWQEQPPGRQWIRYPGSVQRPRLDREVQLRQPKLIVNAGRSRISPWRTKAAIDYVADGFPLFPSHSMYCVLPISSMVSLEFLAAVLNHPIANAWLDSMTYTRWLTADVLRGMPFPRVEGKSSQEAIAKAEGLVRKITAISDRNGGKRVSDAVAQLVGELDDVLFQLYGVSEAEREWVSRLFVGFRRPGGERPVEEGTASSVVKREPRLAMRTISGLVHAVDLDQRRLSVEVRGFPSDGPVWMEITEEMPGWLLRPGALFTAKVSLLPTAVQSLEQAMFDFEVVDGQWHTFDELLLEWNTLTDMVEVTKGSSS